MLIVSPLRICVVNVVPVPVTTADPLVVATVPEPALLPIVSTPETSIANTPPTAPFHAGAPAPAASVAVVYCGTRIT